MSQQATELIARQMASGAANARVWADILYNVKLYGAKGDGITDDTAAFQSAINAIPSGQHGVVFVPPGRYLISGYLTIPKFVTLRGFNEGQFGNQNVPVTSYPPVYGTDIPANQSLLLITGTVSPAITVNTGSCVEGISFFYPNQVGPTATTPIVYPATIKGNFPATDVTVKNCMFYNSYVGIDLAGCDRHRIEWIFGDCLSNGIIINRCHDTSRICHIQFHDFMYAYTSNIGAWKIANGIGINIMRSDNQIIDEVFVWKRNVGIAFGADSTVANEGASFGVGSNLTFDGCTYSLFFTQTQLQSGWDIVNLQCSGSPIIVQTANLVKVNITNPRFWATGAFRALEISNSNPLSVVRLNNAQISNGYTIAPIHSSGSASCKLYLSNVVFEDNSPSINVIDIVGTHQEFLYNGGSVGNNTILIAAMTNKRNISNVLDYNPRGLLTAPAVPASGTLQQNTFPHRVMIIVSGGTVTGLAKNGTNIPGMTTGTFILDPGESITVTYTAVPAWTWFGL